MGCCSSSSSSTAATAKPFSIAATDNKGNVYVHGPLSLGAAGDIPRAECKDLHEGTIHALASATGIVVTGGEDHRMYVNKADLAQESRVELKDGEGSAFSRLIQGVDIAADGSIIGSQFGGVVKIWSAAGELLKTVDLAAKKPGCPVAFLGGDSSSFVAAVDNKVIFEQAGEDKTEMELDFKVSCIVVDQAAGKVLIAGGNTMQIRSLADKNVISEITTSASLDNATMSGDNVAARVGKNVEVYSVQGAKLVQTFSQPAGAHFTQVALNGNALAVGSWDSSVYVFDVTCKELKNKLSGAAAEVLRVAFVN